MRGVCGKCYGKLLGEGQVRWWRMPAQQFLITNRETWFDGALVEGWRRMNHGVMEEVPRSLEVGLDDILGDHALSVEKGAVERDAVAHHIREAVTVMVE